MIRGRIIKALSGFYYVQADNNIYTCKAKGKFRKENISPLVGDDVEIETINHSEGIVSTILSRKNFFERPSVANIDQLVIFSSESIPVTDPYLIDRIISISTIKNCAVLLIINKIDLSKTRRLLDIYSKVNIPIVMTSAITGEGINQLKSLIYGKVNAFTGNSGVGKSSILNVLCPELSLKTDEVSTALGRGKHTTRHVEMFLVDENTFVIDTPGFSSFDTDELNLKMKENLASTFVEFIPYADECLFQDCKHMSEKGCAIKEAVQKGIISRSRYESYLRLKNELKDLHSWNS